VISSLDSFHLSLADFEGPLPLLLHLIEKNELEVTRVSVAAVAEQFIALVAADGMSSDLGTTGEFVAVAARLLLIKSRALLFREDSAEADDEDDGARLVRQIAEYSRYKEAGVAIGDMLGAETATWPRPDVGPADVPRPRPVVRVNALARAARRLLVQVESREDDTDYWPVVVYASVRSELLAEVRRLGTTSFNALCKPDWHPLVVITMFLAVLDAVRAEQLAFRQPVAFGQIDLHMPSFSTMHD
jgi:segregation and condensation protein A